MKFGGTSVESSAAILRIAGIVKTRRDRRPVVVVSAMGKTTNSLLNIARDAASGNLAQATERLHALEEFHARESFPLMDHRPAANLKIFLGTIFENSGN